MGINPKFILTFSILIAFIFTSSSAQETYSVIYVSEGVSVEVNGNKEPVSMNDTLTGKKKIFFENEEGRLVSI